MTAWDRRDKRTDRLGLKLGAQLAWEVRSLARRAGVSVSDFVREAREEKIAAGSSKPQEDNHGP